MSDRDRLINALYDAQSRVVVPYMVSQEKQLQLIIEGMADCLLDSGVTFKKPKRTPKKKTPKSITDEAKQALIAIGENAHGGNTNGSRI